MGKNSFFNVVQNLRRLGWGVIAVMVLLCCGCSHQQTTYVPSGEEEYCREHPDSAICIGLFKQTATKVLEKFRYVNDEELYGKAERWSDLQLTQDQLLGDCEDCAITLANELVQAGLPAEQIVLYLAVRKWQPNHIMIRYGRYFVDCGAKTITRDVRYKLVSRRVITSDVWEPYFHL